jgi:hypothetical protein
MTGEASAGIPPPLDSDDDDVAWALQTAAAQWKRAAFADAIVWLRRAVDSAIQAGHAGRANELSGAAWRLTEQMLARADGPPPAPPASDSGGDIDDLLDIPPPPSGEVISVEFEATRTIPDADTERSLTPSPQAMPANARRSSSNPAGRNDGRSDMRFGGGTPPAPKAVPHTATSRGGRLATPAMRPPPPRERRPPAPPPPPPPPPPREPAPLPSFPLEPVSSRFDLPRGEPSDTVVPQEPDRDTEAPPDPFAPDPSSGSLPAFPSDATETSISAEVEAALGSLSEAPPASEPTVAGEMPFSRPPSQAAAAPSPPPPPSAEPLLGVSLADVRGLQDLPEEAQAKLVSQARIERLSRNDELTGFGVALVLEGWISIMPAIAEVPCARATAGDVVCASGTLDEAIVLSAVAGQEQTAVAVWDKSMLEEATQDCPWVADELRLIADRYQTLAGVTMGAMGDRLDESLRAMVTERCEVRALMPYEVLVERGGPVPALHIVGAGRIELVEGAGDNAEVLDELGPGDFLFAAQVLQGGVAPSVARAGKSGALVLFAERKIAHELLVSVPPLLEIFAT